MAVLQQGLDGENQGGVILKGLELGGRETLTSLPPAELIQVNTTRGIEFLSLVLAL